MTTLLKLLTLIALVFTIKVISVGSTHAGVKHFPLEDADNDLRDIASLQRGAILFANSCMSCHSAKHIRYNRIARDLGWTDEEVIEKMTRGLKKPVDHVMSSMSPEVAVVAFGAKVPDLSLITRVKSADYVYTFLRAYEVNEAGKMDNPMKKGTRMPDVLIGIEKTSTPEEYDQVVRDITNFLEYVGEPGQVQRWDLGWKVLAFLAILFILSYLLKREYWRDIK